MTKFEDVIKSPIPVIVCFYTRWCGACHRMDPIIGELASEYEGKVKFAILDAAKYPQAAAGYYVRTVPTFIIFVDGQPQEKKVGATRRETFKTWLSKWTH